MTVRIVPCAVDCPDLPFAARLYAAYNRGGNPERMGLNYQDKPCPNWSDLPQDVREKWQAVAQFAQGFNAALDPSCHGNGCWWRDNERKAVASFIREYGETTMLEYEESFTEGSIKSVYDVLADAIADGDHVNP